MKRNDFDLFGDWFGLPFETENRRNEVMKTDIEESDNGYKLNIEVPSVKKGDVKVSLNDGYLVVTVEKKGKDIEKDNVGKVIHKERYFGTFKRSYYVGEAIKDNDIDAKLEDGVLVIDVKKPQKEEEKNSKFIEVK